MSLKRKTKIEEMEILGKKNVELNKLMEKAVTNIS
jgi:hypothetical protein